MANKVLGGLKLVGSGVVGAISALGALPGCIALFNGDGETPPGDRVQNVYVNIGRSVSDAGNSPLVAAEGRPSPVAPTTQPQAAIPLPTVAGAATSPRLPLDRFSDDATVALTTAATLAPTAREGSYVVDLEVTNLGPAQKLFVKKRSGVVSEWTLSSRDGAPCRFDVLIDGLDFVHVDEVVQAAPNIRTFQTGQVASFRVLVGCDRRLGAGEGLILSPVISALAPGGAGTPLEVRDIKFQSPAVPAR